MRHAKLLVNTTTTGLDEGEQIDDGGDKMY
jgi:hypothetical protein